MPQQYDAMQAPPFSLRPFPGNQPTLGWQVADWIERYLVQIDGPDAGQPLVLTRDQINWCAHWYAIDRHGKNVWRRGQLRRAKGGGKSPTAGALALAELVGPVCFGGWDENGDPIGAPQPMPWVDIAGVTQEQCDNVLDAVRAMSQGEEFRETYQLDVGKTRILTADGIGKIVPLTTNAEAKEGRRVTAVFVEESHHLREGNGGHALMRVLKRNAAKLGGRILELTNSYEPGLDSVAEQTDLAWRAQMESGGPVDILVDTVEAHGVNLGDEQQVRAALAKIYDQAPWIDQEHILAEIFDPGTTADEARRFYLNVPAGAENAWVDPTKVAACIDDTVRPMEPGDDVVLGFDGSLTDDSTALVAVRTDDGAAFLLALWEKPTGPQGKGWAIDKSEVRDVVDAAHDLYGVLGFASDVAYWEADVDEWRNTYGESYSVKASFKHAVALDMRGNQKEITTAAEALNRRILEGKIIFGPGKLLNAPSVDSRAALVRHIQNARRRLNRFGVTFGKENRESPKKVDALAALLLASIMHSKLGEPGARKVKRTGTFYSFA